MNIFLICGVRGATEAQIEMQQEHVQYLEEQGHMVHYPPRDTNQNDATGYNICKQNMAAIQAADRVDIMAYDSKLSEGSLFDLGMAFALGKQINPVIGHFPTLRNVASGKSFVRMIWKWEDEWWAEEA